MGNPPPPVMFTAINKPLYLKKSEWIFPVMGGLYFKSEFRYSHPMIIYGGYKRNEPHSQALRKLITPLRKKALLTYIPLGKAKIRMGRMHVKSQPIFKNDYKLFDIFCAEIYAFANILDCSCTQFCHQKDTSSKS